MPFEIRGNVHLIHTSLGTTEYQDQSPPTTHHPHSIRMHAARARIARRSRWPSLCRTASRWGRSKVTGREGRDVASRARGTIGREWRHTWVMINGEQFGGESSNTYHQGETWNLEGMEEDHQEADPWLLGAA